MKIAIITDSIDKKSPGISSYSRNLIDSLLRIDKKNVYTLIHHKEDEFYSGKKHAMIPSGNSVFSHFYRKFFSLPDFIRKNNFDIVHDTYHFLPFRISRPRKIITVYDVYFLIDSKSHTFINSLAHRLLIKYVTRKADRILTISHSTRRDLTRIVGVPASKINVILLSANKNYRVLGKKNVARVRKKYRLGFPYILYVGTLEPRKNIPNLIRAYWRLAENNRIPHRLVIAGKKGWKYREIFETVRRLGAEKRVVFTGFVPEEDLPALYNGAELFVYPSFYEGFGLPPLEAMQCGCPVITSGTSSMPEVVGDAAIKANPHDIGNISESMLRVLKDRNLRRSMIAKGLKRARQFSWERCARETLRVYEEVNNENQMDRLLQ